MAAVIFSVDGVVMPMVGVATCPNCAHRWEIRPAPVLNGGDRVNLKCPSCGLQWVHTEPSTLRRRIKAAPCRYCGTPRPAGRCRSCGAP